MRPFSQAAGTGAASADLRGLAAISESAVAGECVGDDGSSLFVFGAAGFSKNDGEEKAVADVTNHEGRAPKCARRSKARSRVTGPRKMRPIPSVPLDAPTSPPLAAGALVASDELCGPAATTKSAVVGENVGDDGPSPSVFGAQGEDTASGHLHLLADGLEMMLLTTIPSVIDRAASAKQLLQLLQADPRLRQWFDAVPTTVQADFLVFGTGLATARYEEFQRTQYQAGPVRIRPRS